MSLKSFIGNAKGKVQSAIGKVKSNIAMNKGIGFAKPANKSSFGYGYKPTQSQSRNLKTSMSIPSGVNRTGLGRNLAQGGLRGAANVIEGGMDRFNRGINNIQNAIKNPNMPNFGGGVRDTQAGQNAANRIPDYNSYGPIWGSKGIQSVNNTPMQDAPDPISNLTIRGGANAVDPTNPQVSSTRIAQEKAMNQTLANDAVGGASTASTGDFSTPQDFLDAKIENLQNQQEAEDDGGLSDIQSQIDELMNQEYPQQDQLNALLQEEQRIKNESAKALQEISGQAIPYQFIQGQGARVQNLAQNDLSRVAGQQQTLQQMLAQEQAKRRQMVDILQNRDNQQQQGKRDAAEMAYKERTRAEDRAFEMMKFNEDKRRYGQDYALRAQSARNSGSSTKYSTYTGKNIPGGLKSDLITDLTSRGGRRGRGRPNFTKPQVYAAYPEVDTDYIDSLYDSLS